MQEVGEHMLGMAVATAVVQIIYSIQAVVGQVVTQVMAALQALCLGRRALATLVPAEAAVAVALTFQQPAVV
jgi:hypothetical protein